MSDYETYLLWKAGAVLVAAFVWGLFCGLTGRQLNGRPLSGEPLDKGPAE